MRRIPSRSSKTAYLGQDANDWSATWQLNHKICYLAMIMIIFCSLPTITDALCWMLDNVS